jgi:hypothetical protein
MNGTAPPPRGGKIHVAADRLFAHRRRGVVTRGTYFANSNRGHGAPGPGAWPTVKLDPEPEYCSGLDIRRAHRAHRTWRECQVIERWRSESPRQRRDRDNAGPETGDWRPWTGDHDYFQAAIALPCAEPGPELEHFDPDTQPDRSHSQPSNRQAVPEPRRPCTPRCFNAATYAFKSVTCKP